MLPAAARELPPFPDDAADANTPLAAETALVQLGERLARSLGVARTLLRHGRAVDLTGIDDTVGQFCARALDLQPERGRTLLPLVHALTLLVEDITQAIPHPPALGARTAGCHPGEPAP